MTVLKQTCRLHVLPSSYPLPKDDIKHTLSSQTGLPQHKQCPSHGHLSRNPDPWQVRGKEAHCQLPVDKQQQRVWPWETWISNISRPWVRSCDYIMVTSSYFPIYFQLAKDQNLGAFELTNQAKDDLWKPLVVKIQANAMGHTRIGGSFSPIKIIPTVDSYNPVSLEPGNDWL